MLGAKLRIYGVRIRVSETLVADGNGRRTDHSIVAGCFFPGLAGPSTIHRVLVRRGFVTPQPQKRPRNSWTRFESDLPNETWQSDMTHWHLEGNVPVEIINYIDDCSRAVLCSSVVKVATSADVVRLFFSTADLYGLPASVLSDIQDR